MADSIQLVVPRGLAGDRAAPVGAPPQTVVLGWEGQGWWPALHQLRRARSSLRAGRTVLLVRGEVRQPWRHALFPTDFSARSLAALRLARRALPPMCFTLLHACRAHGDGYLQAAGVGADAVEACRRRAEAAARAAGWRFAAQAPPGDTRLAVLALRQPWIEAVAAYANDAGPDLLVLDGAPAPWWRRALQRHRLRALLARTRCDVLLLPASPS